MSGLESIERKFKFKLKNEEVDTARPLKISQADVDSQNSQKREIVFPVEAKQKAVENFLKEEATEGQASISWLETRVIEGSPKLTMLFQNALVLMENEEYSLAQNILRTILNERSSCPQAIFRLGQCFEVKDVEKALFCYSKLRDQVGDHESHYYYASALYQLGRDEEAYENYLKALGSPRFDETKLFETYKNIGNILVRFGDYEGAEENYHKAFGLNSESDTLLVNFGTLEIQRENLEAAKEQFRRAIEINDQNDKAWVGLALVHRRFADFELCWANLERALDLNGTNRTAVQLAVEWGLADQKINIAIKYLINFIENDSENIEISFILAKALFCAGRLPEALLEIERTLALDPKIEGGLEVQRMIKKELEGRFGEKSGT